MSANKSTSSTTILTTSSTTMSVTMLTSDHLVHLHVGHVQVHVQVLLWMGFNEVGIDIIYLSKLMRNLVTTVLCDYRSSLLKIWTIGCVRFGHHSPAKTPHRPQTATCNCIPCPRNIPGTTDCAIFFAVMMMSTAVMMMMAHMNTLIILFSRLFNNCF